MTMNVSGATGPATSSPTFGDQFVAPSHVGRPATALPDLADVTVVIPTIGRASLQRLLDSLSVQDLIPAAVVVVDDRPQHQKPPVSVAARLGTRICWIRSAGRGPAAARNIGWRAATTGWVTFLDDDVIVPSEWSTRLADDLSACGSGIAGVQGRIEVPLSDERPPTDWERQVAGLESAVWATADMAFRRTALEAVGGFDERFRRAFREDADLALRLQDAGWDLRRGARRCVHPVPAADALVSVRRQAGNADDALMRVLHGRHWRTEAHAPRGRRRRHLAITAALAVAAAFGARGHRRTSATAAAMWAAGTAEFAAARIAPGPRDRRELTTMLMTSLLIPPAATAHWVRGWLGIGAAVARGPRTAPSDGAADRRRNEIRREVPLRRQAAAVLFDRDGTLLIDEPYNGDPARVAPMPRAVDALEELRTAGLATAVVSNQSGIGRGLLTRDDVDAVNQRMQELLGPIGPVLVCPHEPTAACNCRKPEPGMILEAAHRLGVEPSDCVVIGDIGSDVQAAQAAGARAVLVPTSVTRREEIAEAPVVAPDLESAVRLVLGGAV